jgi:hypothetical protein
MRGAWRLTIAGLAAGLLRGPLPALAQEAPAPATTNAPAADTVGPRELQNFSLQGNVTRPADQPAQQPVAERPTAARQQPAVTVPAAREPARRTAEASTPAPRATTPAPRQLAQAKPESQPQPQPIIPADASALPTTPAPSPASAPAFPATPDTPAEHRFPLLPWILAAIALAASGIFLFWRSRSRPAVAGGPQIDMFAAPEPAPAPAPRPAPAPAPRSAPAPPRAETPPAPPPPMPAGIVSTALRPWVDISAQPLRCIVSDDSVTIEFELELFNSGNAPARDILVEALIVNAGPTQDQELAAFFARPPGPGNRIELIHPLSRTAFTTQVVTARDHISVLEAAGRELFVPLLAFNAFYRRGSGDAQTSVAYLLGRDGNGGGKMAPFRIDQGARVFRGLGARQLPNGVRR